MGARVHYVGFDIHKKTIAFCVKTACGTIRDEGMIAATRDDLRAWASSRKRPWIGAMEATLFTGWVAAVRLQAEGLPDARHGGVGQAACGRHRARRPMGRPAGRLRFKGRADCVGDPLVADRPRPAGARLVGQSLNAIGQEALTPITDHRVGKTDGLGDLDVQRSIGSHQDNPRPLDDRGRQRARTPHCFKPLTHRRIKNNRCFRTSSSSHDKHLSCTKRCLFP